MAAKKHKFWFDVELAELLAAKINEVYPNFDRPSFVDEIDNGINDLELKARLQYFAARLRHHLPNKYPEAIAILTSILGAENSAETGMFTNFYWVMPIATYVEKYGLEYFEESIEAISEITKRSTGEFAIRPYLIAYPDRTLEVMKQWSLDDNFHLRRLASEGCRPRLPWASKLDLVIQNPSFTLPILDNLKGDPIKYVQKSVANHLNDILKDNYDFGMDIIQNWLKESSPARRWIIKHALRKQFKDGNKKAIAIRQSLS